MTITIKDKAATFELDEDTITITTDHGEVTVDRRKTANVLALAPKDWDE